MLQCVPLVRNKSLVYFVLWETNRVWKQFFSQGYFIQMQENPELFGAPRLQRRSRKTNKNKSQVNHCFCECVHFFQRLKTFQDHVTLTPIICWLNRAPGGPVPQPWSLQDTRAPLRLSSAGSALAPRQVGEGHRQVPEQHKGLQPWHSDCTSLGASCLLRSTLNLFGHFHQSLFTAS